MWQKILFFVLIFSFIYIAVCVYTVWCSIYNIYIILEDAEYPLTVSCQQMSRIRAQTCKSHPGTKGASAQTASGITLLLRFSATRALADQSHSLITSLLANSRCVHWRHQLKITWLYLGRSPFRYVHSRAPAADGKEKWVFSEEKKENYFIYIFIFKYIYTYIYVCVYLFVNVYMWQEFLVFF